jgi:hypothetical protein
MVCSSGFVENYVGLDVYGYSNAHETHFFNLQLNKIGKKLWALCVDIHMHLKPLF